MKNSIWKFLLFLVFPAILLSGAASAINYDDDLVRYIARQKNKIPKKYTAPTETQIQLFREMIYDMLQGAFSGASQIAGILGYNIKSMNENNGLTYYILESADPKHRPWGTYVFYLGGNNQNYIIEVPHPFEEKNTSIIGIKAFITDSTFISHGNSNAFFMSGSRKGEGDVANIEDSMFLAAHKEAVDNRHSTIVQIHGFNKKSYPQIVMTSGSPVGNSEMDAFFDQFIQREFDVGTYNGIQYQDCGATENKEAQYCNAVGIPFVGIFLNKQTHYSHRKSTLVEQGIKEVTVSETFGIE